MSINYFQKEEISHLLKLQELFYNRFLNLELLNELVSLYVKAIGYCNQKMSLMKVYFLQKMQFLLSRPQTERLLNQNEEQRSADKYTIKISSLQIEYQTPQYVRKSSLHSQPVYRKLADMNDEQEKIREREYRINQQLEEMRRQIQSVREKSSESINKKARYDDIQLGSDFFKVKGQMHLRKRRKSRKNSLDLQMYKNQIIQQPNEQKLNKNKQELSQFQSFIDKKLGKLKIQQTKNKKNVTFQQTLQPSQQDNQTQSQMVEREQNCLSLQKTIKILHIRNQQEQVIEQQCHTIEFEKQANQFKKQGIFYSFSHGTFAAGCNTPQFSQSSRTKTEPNGFPEPKDQNMTDVTQISISNPTKNKKSIQNHTKNNVINSIDTKNKNQVENKSQIEQNLVINSEQQYVDDEYF